MAYISIAYGYKLAEDCESFIDRRFALSKTEMRSVHINSRHTIASGTYDEEGLGNFLVDDHFFCVCKGDNIIYYLDFDATFDEDTGYFRPAFKKSGYKVSFNSSTATIEEV